MKNQELATDGPYRFVRHPLYTGNILLVVGFALAASRWWNLPVALFFFWFYYPTRDRVRRPQTASHFRRGMGAVVGPHARPDAALRRRAVGRRRRPHVVPWR